MLIVLKHVNLLENIAKATKLMRGLRPLKLLDQGVESHSRRVSVSWGHCEWLAKRPGRFKLEVSAPVPNE